MTPSPLRLSVLLALSTSLAAQGAKVVPPNLTKVEGQDSFFSPFIYDKGRFQQVWEGTAVCASAAVINQISFRRDTNRSTGAYAAIVRSNTTVSLGVTKVSPGQMTTNFNNNLGTGRLTTLVNGVNYTVPAQPAPGNGPAPFNVHYPLTSPFIYTNNAGHLLMQWVVPGNATQKDAYYLDGERRTAPAGSVRSFGKFGSFGSGEQPSFDCDPAGLVPGGTLALSVDGLKSKYPAYAFFGDSENTWTGIPLPLDLSVIGAQGSTLYTGRIIEIPMTVQSSGNGFQASMKSVLPNNQSFAGEKIYAQCWFADQSANGLGLVTSNALELTASNGQPYSRILYSANSSNATGNFEAPIGGPVVRFSGSIN